MQAQAKYIACQASFPGGIYKQYLKQCCRTTMTPITASSSNTAKAIAIKTTFPKNRIAAKLRVSVPYSVHRWRFNASIHGPC